MRKEKSSVTEGMQICLPTTCHLIGIPRHFGQAGKAALLHKEEVATQVLATLLEKNIQEISFLGNFHCSYSVYKCQSQENLVRALNGHTIHLSEEYLNAIDNIGQHHFPKTQICFIWRN